MKDDIRTILEELVRSLQSGELTVYEREMIEDAEKEIYGIIEKAVANVIKDMREVKTSSEILGYAKKLEGK